MRDYTSCCPLGFFLFFHGSATVGFNEVKVKVLKRVFEFLVDIDVYIMCSFHSNNEESCPHPKCRSHVDIFIENIHVRIALTERRRHKTCFQDYVTPHPLNQTYPDNLFGIIAWMNGLILHLPSFIICIIAFPDVLVKQWLPRCHTKMRTPVPPLKKNSF